MNKISQKVNYNEQFKNKVLCCDHCCFTTFCIVGIVWCLCNGYERNYYSIYGGYCGYYILHNIGPKCETIAGYFWGIISYLNALNYLGTVGLLMFQNTLTANIPRILVGSVMG